DPSLLRRTPTPDPVRLADEYLVDLEPVRVIGVPAVSLASYRKDFRASVERLTDEIDGKNGNWRRIELEADLCRPGQIGQLLGFANACEQENRYRQLYFARIGKRPLVYNDYWDSMEEYEAYMQEYRERSEHSLVKEYEGMRAGVTWLVNNRDMISRGVAEWRLLFRIDSNVEMNLNMMDADPLYVF